MVAGTINDFDAPPPAGYPTIILFDLETGLETSFRGPSIAKSPEVNSSDE